MGKNLKIFRNKLIISRDRYFFTKDIIIIIALDFGFFERVFFKPIFDLFIYTNFHYYLVRISKKFA